MDTMIDDPHLVQTYLVDMPTRIHGVVVHKMDEDGQDCYAIMVNSRLNDEQQLDAYNHECQHINCGDLWSNIGVEELEALRHTD